MTTQTRIEPDCPQALVRALLAEIAAHRQGREGDVSAALAFVEVRLERVAAALVAPARTSPDESSNALKIRARRAQARLN